MRFICASPADSDAGHRQYTNDNDGLWTSYYVAAEAFRYAVTGDPQAKINARRSLEALMFLERITGIPGFAARSIIPIDDDSHKHGGEWHRSADGKWWWKGDTSSDEVDGHYFAYAIYYNVAADEGEKKEIAAYVGRITDHILDHGFYYVGPPATSVAHPPPPPRPATAVTQPTFHRPHRWHNHRHPARPPTAVRQPPFCRPDG